MLIRTNYNAAPAEMGIFYLILTYETIPGRADSMGNSKELKNKKQNKTKQNRTDCKLLQRRLSKL